MLLSLAGCTPAGESGSEANIRNSDNYESSGIVFFIPEAEFETVKAKALAGDDKQIQRLIDHYMFSFLPQDIVAKVELQNWQRLGADRGLKGSAHNLLYLASAEAGPDCLTLKKHSRALSPKDLESLRENNGYLNACFSESMTPSK